VFAQIWGGEKPGTAGKPSPAGGGEPGTTTVEPGRTGKTGAAWKTTLPMEGEATEGADPLVTGCVCVPRHRGEPCGDWWGVRHERGRGRSRVLVVDGLGHGVHAAKAADEAVRVFHLCDASDLVELIQTLHGALRPTRGASVAVAEVDYGAGMIRYTGVGNISGVILSGNASHGMVSHNGTVGHELHRVKVFEYKWGPDAVLVMHTDGLGSRWNLDDYPGLITRHPSLGAGVLYRDFRRERDDVTVLMAMAPGGFATPLNQK
jgi:hypothetical protein